MMKDYYKILEVNKSASSEIISKVYKILAKKYHPDMNKDNPEQAEEKFKEISEAYDILSDDEKRKTYDKELEAYEKEQSQEDTSKFVAIETFLELKHYCEKLEHSIAELVTGQNNNELYNPEPQYIHSLEVDEINNPSVEELELQIAELKRQEKMEKRTKRIELLKSIIAAIIMIVFVIWFLKQNNYIIK